MQNQTSSNEQDRAKYIGDLIGDKYKSWDNEFIVFDADTGTGKTHFILHTLALYMASQGKSMLYLCNRTALRQGLQVQVRRLRHHNIDVMSYQKLQVLIQEEEELKRYDYVIFDEIHYLTSDSFNEYTDVAWGYLMEQTGNVCILMSATAKSFFSSLLVEGRVKEENWYSISLAVAERQGAEISFY